MIETNRIEYKEKLTDSLEKEVVAFLNYIGGGKVYPLLLVAFDTIFISTSFQ